MCQSARIADIYSLQVSKTILLVALSKTTRPLLSLRAPLEPVSQQLNFKIPNTDTLQLPFPSSSPPSRSALTLLAPNLLASSFRLPQPPPFPALPTLRLCLPLALPPWSLRFPATLLPWSLRFQPPSLRPGARLLLVNHLLSAAAAALFLAPLPDLLPLLRLGMFLPLGLVRLTGKSRPKIHDCENAR